MCYDYLLKKWENLCKNIPYDLHLDSYIYYDIFPRIPRPAFCSRDIKLLNDSLKLLDDYYFNKDFKYYRCAEVLDCDIEFFLKLKKEYLKGGE